MTSTINQRDAVTIRRREERFYERAEIIRPNALLWLESDRPALGTAGCAHAEYACAEELLRSPLEQSEERRERRREEKAARDRRQLLAPALVKSELSIPPMEASGVPPSEIVFSLTCPRCSPRERLASAAAELVINISLERFKLSIAVKSLPRAAPTLVNVWTGRLCDFVAVEGSAFQTPLLHTKDLDVDLLSN